MNIRNVVIGLGVAAIVSGIIVACGGGSGGGGGGAPAVASGSGRGALVVDTGTGAITGSVFFSGMSGTATSVGIYQAAAGANANPNTSILDLTIGGPGATVPANATALTPTQITALQANQLYFLVKTSTFPNGELRGQINNTAGITGRSVNLDPTQEVPPTTSIGSGRGTVVVNSTTGEIIAGVITFTGLTSSASASHIHSGTAVTPSGPIRIFFDPPSATSGTATVLDPTVGMQPSDLTDLAANNQYFNVHSTTNPGGEIRGQFAAGTQDVRSAVLDTTQVVQ